MYIVICIKYYIINYCVSVCVCPWKLVNVITCEIIDLASPNSVCKSLFARSRMSTYMGHPNLLSRSPQPEGASIHPCGKVYFYQCKITDMLMYTVFKRELFSHRVFTKYQVINAWQFVNIMLQVKNYPTYRSQWVVIS